MHVFWKWIHATDCETGNDVHLPFTRGPIDSRLRRKTLNPGVFPSLSGSRWCGIWTRWWQCIMQTFVNIITFEDERPPVLSVRGEMTETLACSASEFIPGVALIGYTVAFVMLCNCMWPTKVKTWFRNTGNSVSNNKILTPQSKQEHFSSRERGLWPMT